MVNSLDVCLPTQEVTLLRPIDYLHFFVVEFLVCTLKIIAGINFNYFCLIFIFHAITASPTGVTI